MRFGKLMLLVANLEGSVGMRAVQMLDYDYNISISSGKRRYTSNRNKSMEIHTHGNISVY